MTGWKTQAPDGQFVEHGGNLAAAQARFGVPAMGWMDLSTGINPHSYPLPEIDTEFWTRLPDDAVLDELLAAARVGYGVGPSAHIVAAPGTQAIIQWLPRLREAGSVAVLGPTYGEHARTWSMAGHDVQVLEFVSEEAVMSLDAQVIVLVNPNNPDGRVFPLELLATVAERQARRGGLLIVDCAFADVCPSADVSALAGQAGLVVLRSFGKFFGLAGVRLGFALMDQVGAAALRTAMGPWAISGPAACVAGHALKDRGWAETMRARLGAEAAQLDGVLTRNGLAPAGGTSLYRLVATPDATAMFEHLAGQGILTRPFAQYGNWLRFGLVASGQELARLDQALASS